MTHIKSMAGEIKTINLPFKKPTSRMPPELRKQLREELTQRIILAWEFSIATTSGRINQARIADALSVDQRQISRYRRGHQTIKPQVMLRSDMRILNDLLRRTHLELGASAKLRGDLMTTRIHEVAEDAYLDITRHCGRFEDYRDFEDLNVYLGSDPELTQYDPRRDLV